MPPADRSPSTFSTPIRVYRALLRPDGCSGDAHGLKTIKSNEITITVLPALSDDVALKSLKLSVGTLNPVFAAVNTRWDIRPRLTMMSPRLR